jgi:hypothetical protein
LSTHVTNEDGTAADLAEHLSSEHRKGTRGVTDAYLAGLHEKLHQSRREPLPGHEHPVVMIPSQGGPVDVEAVVA